MEIKSNILIDLDIVRDLAIMTFLGEYISHSDGSVLVSLEDNVQHSYDLVTPSLPEGGHATTSSSSAKVSSLLSKSIHLSRRLLLQFPNIDTKNPSVLQPR